MHILHLIRLACNILNGLGNVFQSLIFLFCSPGCLFGGLSGNLGGLGNLLEGRAGGDGGGEAAFVGAGAFSPLADSVVRFTVTLSVASE